MTWTGIYRHTNGTDTLYAMPLATGAFTATGIVTGSDTDQDTLYVFAGLADGSTYEIRIRAGGSPVAGDLAIASLGNVDLTPVLDRLPESGRAASEDNVGDATQTLAGGINSVGSLVSALNDFDPATDTVARVTLVDTTTTNTDMRGTNDAALAATALSTSVWTNTKAGFLDRPISQVAGGGGGGSGLIGPNELTVTVTDVDDDEPIEAATVRLYRSGQSGTQATNSSGVTIFGLDTATWSWIAEASGYTTRTGTVAVSGDGTLPIELTLLPSATSPPTGSFGLCEVSVDIYENGQLLRDGTGWAHAVLADPTANADNLLLNQSATRARANDQGRVLLRLIRQDQLTQGNADYTVTISGSNGVLRTVTIRIPNQDAANLEDLISS